MTARRVFIPPAGAALKLASDWTFQLYLESRNAAIIKALGKDVSKLPQYGSSTEPITLPAGTSIVTHEYSIRRGGFAADSRVVFAVWVAGAYRRVWVNLDDANNIEVV